MIQFEERYFPTFKQTRPENFSRRKNKSRLDESDEYFIYKLEEEEIVFEWVDKWFKDRTDRENYTKIWTIKKVDEKTSYHLYNRFYNPFSIRIMPQYKNETLFALKAMIHSVDDSSYGVWFNNITLDVAQDLQVKIAEYINEQKILNGDLFFKFAEGLGANDFDTN